MVSAVILNVFSSISTNTGVAPTYLIASAVAIKVKALVITSSPFVIPSASRARCKASVPDAQPIACLTPRYSAASFSNACTLGPKIKEQLAIVSAIPCSISSLISAY